MRVEAPPEIIRREVFNSAVLALPAVQESTAEVAARVERPGEQHRGVCEASEADNTRWHEPVVEV